MAVLLGAVAALVVVIKLTGPPSDDPPTVSSAAAGGATASSAADGATFVGSQGCAGCHGSEFEAWQGSHHQLAIQPATAESVLGDFSDVTFTADGSTTRFLLRGERFLVETEGPNGEIGEFEIRYTFGVEPLQQYLLEGERGRLQVLPVAWDSRGPEDGGQRWFSLYPGERLRPGDELHWTGRQQNWNYMCADCHSTDLRRGYDAAADSFATTWSELSVGCEACHGPGSAHVAWAESGGGVGGPALTVALDERRGVSWSTDEASGLPRRSAPPTSRREVDLCAQCHSRRSQVAEGYRAGAPLLDHYLPSLLEPGMYHPDGQQLEEVFTWGSFVQSRMYAAGVTCSDCHDPHSGALRAEGNALCATCHTPVRYDAVEHHFHPAGSEGTLCVSCHMPATTYMQVDPRRDHGMHVPRPQQSAALGTPDACTACHTGRDVEWAAAAVRRWYGAERPSPAFVAAFSAHELGAEAAPGALSNVATDRAAPPVVRASALARLATVPAAVAFEAVRAALVDGDPLVRRSALLALEAVVAPESQIELAAPLLSDPVHGVRLQAAWLVAPGWTSLSAPGLRAAFDRASREFVAAQRLMADRSESRVTLGNYFARLGRPAEAEAEYRAALTRWPGEVAAYVNLADLLGASGREDEGERLLRDGLRTLPSDAALRHALGLSLARSGRTAEATQELAAAAAAAPQQPRFAYAHAVALHSSGDVAGAMAVLDTALERHPADYDLLFGAATFLRDAGRRVEAHEYALRLREAHPQDPTARRLEEALR